MKKFILLLANSQRYFIHALRIGIFITLLGAVIKTLSFHDDSIYYVVAALIIAVGAMNLLGIWFHKVGLIGGLLLFAASAVLLAWLVIEGIADGSLERLLSYSLSVFGPFITFMTVSLICASDCAKQIFRAYVLRMGKGSGV